MERLNAFATTKKPCLGTTKKKSALTFSGYISGMAFFIGLFVLLPGAAGGIEGGDFAGGALCLAAGLLLTFFGMAGLRGESVGE